MSAIRDYILGKHLEPVPVQRRGPPEEQWVPTECGLWLYRGDKSDFGQHVIVFGDASNRLLCHPHPVPEHADAWQVEDVRQKNAPGPWSWVWIMRLVAPDRLPLGYGGSVEGYIQQCEAEAARQAGPTGDAGEAGVPPCGGGS